MFIATAVAAAAAAASTLAIVVQDQTALRAAPSATAATHAQLWQSEVVEVRGHKLDHAQVYEHRRERAGYVRASQLRALPAGEADAPQLLAVLRFLRDAPGSEALGIAYVAAYLKAAPAGQITAEPFDVLGTLAERLAQRASTRGANPTAANAHLEVAAQYGVKFNSHERQGSVQLCYDGAAFAQVLALAGKAPASQAAAGGAPAATPEQRARALLALTRHDCIDPALGVRQRQALNRWRAELLDQIEPLAAAQLGQLDKARLHLRRAGVWAAVAFDQSRRGESTQASAQRALSELAAVNKAELADDDAAPHVDAAIRVGALRWAAATQAAAPPPGRLHVQLRAGEPGQTCVQLVAAAGMATQDAAKSAAKNAAGLLHERCTYATVWPASAQVRPDGQALALSVQPLEGWAELWLWRRQAGGWTVDVLPAASSGPGLGYVEWAGWVPGAAPRLLVVREFIADGRAGRRFEVLGADTLAVEKSASSPQLLAAFGQWAAPAWKRGTVSLR